MEKDREYKISVIVPVYNTEKYLDRCILSILDQTYQNLEIILVNDGSTDQSIEILKKYERKDERVKVICQNNGGASKARNKGLNVASGDYISFIDSDDYIEKTMYEDMLNMMIKNNVDICACMWKYENSLGKNIIDLEKVKNDIYGKKESRQFAEFLYKGSYENGVVVSSCNKLYNKKVWNNEKFEGRYFEDDRVLQKILSKEYSVYVMKSLYYVYVENEQSTTHRLSVEQQENFLKILEERIQLYKDSASILNQTMVLYLNLYMEYYFTIEKERRYMIIKHQNYFKKYLALMRKIHILSKKLLLRSIIFSISPSIYQFLVNFKGK